MGGTYCDVYDDDAFGTVIDEKGLKKCKGSSITVSEDGTAKVTVEEGTSEALFFVFDEVSYC